PHLPTGPDELRLQVWRTYGPGGPQVLLSRVPWQKGAWDFPGAITYLLSAATGELGHALPGVFPVWQADFNGDGAPDLYYETSNGRGGRSIRVYPGAPRRKEAWRAPGKAGRWEQWPLP